MLPVRSSMADMITRVRRYIGDPAGTSAQWADSDIQDTLDTRRITVRYQPLRPEPTLQPGGIYLFQDYFADVGEWESDLTLQGPGYAYITPTLAELTTGHWQLPAPNNSPAGQVPPVYITGKLYDTWAAAADLLENWAALVARDFDYALDGQNVHRSQKAAALNKQAELCRRKARPRTWVWDRSDMNGPNPPLANIIGGAPINGWW